MYLGSQSPKSLISKQHCINNSFCLELGMFDNNQFQRFQITYFVTHTSFQVSWARETGPVSMGFVLFCFPFVDSEL